MANLNSGTILLAFVAILFGLAGTYALRTYLNRPTIVQNTQPPPPKPPQKVTVPLASREIGAGTKLTLDDIALYRMTREEIKKSLGSAAFMTNPDQILGKVLAKDLDRGKPFNTRDFYPAGEGPGIAKRLAPGLRALTLMLEPTNALLGYAGPGQHVDVLFHYGVGGSDGSAANGGAGGNGNNDDDGRFYPQHHDFNPPRRRDYYGNTIGGGGVFGGGPGGASGIFDDGLTGATVTLVQDSEILALGRKSIPTDAASGLPLDELVPVTLAVTPREAELLRVAGGHGQLSLTLRGPDDQKKVALLDPVTLNEIIDVKNHVHNMVIHRGRSVSSLKFAGGVKIQKKMFDQDTQGIASSNAGVFPSPLPAFNVVAPYYWPQYPVHPQSFGAGSSKKQVSDSKGQQP